MEQLSLAFTVKTYCRSLFQNAAATGKPIHDGLQTLVEENNSHWHAESEGGYIKQLVTGKPSTLTEVFP